MRRRDDFDDFLAFGALGVGASAAGSIFASLPANAATTASQQGISNFSRVAFPVGGTLLGTRLVFRQLGRVTPMNAKPRRRRRQFLI